ncbi:LysR family transcriptional regulator [Pararhizobium mangrovi]|uniref:LysR family transcriptional regulator n=1 Tax=Pararhizobium mangrovi TaxID=2590452 RepID=A0A506U4C9_9HYPH|nr:LysR family transcriptional regulator [Pararhizobium mangrovi]
MSRSTRQAARAPLARNLRHLRLFLEVARSHSLTVASSRCHVSQPAVTQAIGKLETQAEGVLFTRTSHGFYSTERGEALVRRVERVFAMLDPALADISPRLIATATISQLEALIAVCESENFTLAAKRLGLAQPTVHRAVAQLEHEATRPLFERTSFGVVAGRACLALARAAHLAFYELQQASAELAELEGRDEGTVVIGSLPLARSVLLPRALVRFRAERPSMRVTVHDGLYDVFLSGLRRGEIDFMIGALRDPPPINDVVQEALFDDRLVIVARLDHPLARLRAVGIEDLVDYPWIVPRPGTPSRAQFDALFAQSGPSTSPHVMEAGSILLMREMLRQSDHLGCVSGQQAQAEIANGLLARIDATVRWPARAIGLTMRSEWQPTGAQRRLIDIVREEASRLEPL